ncbi:anthranilate synthase component 1 [Homoserinimonas aerilata]|uniref:Anthranilate synthase component 1 n=1 Tax=Homoserinimonas aerilata TaxID=1162970 RepID=A0A542YI98_9MICO|nr:anthranilate synthase component I family protein [Homoserinimonas aerilata]TQL47819.1 anthranilate synthase component 1 [Homoserinimonas aerilata]
MRRRVLESDWVPWIDPAKAYSALFARRENSFWLDSGTDAVSGMSAMGASDVVLIDGPGHPILDALDRGLADAAGVDAGEGEGFRLGWVGWLGYELRETTMGEPVARGAGQPRATMMFVDRALVFDHRGSRMRLLALGESWNGELAEWRDEVIAVLRETSCGEADAEPRPASGALASRSARWRYSDAEYLTMIAQCQDAIRAGDAYQLCLTNEASLDVEVEPLEAYLRLRAASPAHHGGLLRFGAESLLSASPEQFLEVRPGGVVTTRPIKGTRRRGADQEEDARLREELLASDKERAENLMIVDLMRNDLSTVCVTGTVRVSSLLAVESYPQVHQLVSTVTGHLRPGLTAIDAVRACFPAGSMTGAPKRSATRILDRLEGRARGVYSGAFGHFGLDGRADLAMVIRSIVVDARGATIGAGGGITALSVPQEELEEVRIKAAALMAVLGASVR